jgi:hypothetical protein
MRMPYMGLLLLWEVGQVRPSQCIQICDDGQRLFHIYMSPFPHQRATNSPQTVGGVERDTRSLFHLTDDFPPVKHRHPLSQFI